MNKDRYPKGGRGVGGRQSVKTFLKRKSKWAINKKRQNQGKCKLNSQLNATYTNYQKFLNQTVLVVIWRNKDNTYDLFGRILFYLWNTYSMTKKTPFLGMYPRENCNGIYQQTHKSIYSSIAFNAITENPNMYQ